MSAIAGACQPESRLKNGVFEAVRLSSALFAAVSVPYMTRIASDFAVIASWIWLTICPARRPRATAAGWQIRRAGFTNGRPELVSSPVEGGRGDLRISAADSARQVGPLWKHCLCRLLESGHPQPQFELRAHVAIGGQSGGHGSA